MPPIVPKQIQQQVSDVIGKPVEFKWHPTHEVWYLQFRNSVGQKRWKPQKASGIITLEENQELVTVPLFKKTSSGKHVPYEFANHNHFDSRLITWLHKFDSHRVGVSNFIRQERARFEKHKKEVKREDADNMMEPVEDVAKHIIDKPVAPLYSIPETVGV